jgi:hypothetical protein
MADVVFPSNVEQFIGLTNEFLARFKLSMVLREQIPEFQSRTYEVEAQDGLVQMIVHRTTRSWQASVGEYRIRVKAEVPPEFANIVRGKEAVVNRVATLGALTISETVASVATQCLVPERLQDATAGVLAVAVAHARRSLIASHMIALLNDQTKSVEQLSVWTDLDLEKVHYDYAHLGIGTLAPRRWTLDLVDCGVLSMHAVYNNPYWGGGLLCLLRVKRPSIVFDGEQIEVNDLNAWGNLVSDTPTFGAWCSEGDDFVFVQFVPNFMKPLLGLTDLMIAWARARGTEARNFVEFERQFRKDRVAEKVS